MSGRLKYPRIILHFEDPEIKAVYFYRQQQIIF